MMIGLFLNVVAEVIWGTWDLHLPESLQAMVENLHKGLWSVLWQKEVIWGPWDLHLPESFQAMLENLHKGLWSVGDQDMWGGGQCQARSGINKNLVWKKKTH